LFIIFHKMWMNPVARERRDKFIITSNIPHTPWGCQERNKKQNKIASRKLSLHAILQLPYQEIDKLLRTTYSLKTISSGISLTSSGCLGKWLESISPHIWTALQIPLAESSFLIPFV